jgi:hypothetical protein
VSYEVTGLGVVAGHDIPERTLIEFDEAIVAPGHYRFYAALPDHGGDLLCNSKIDGLFLESKAACRAGVLTAVPGVNYDAPG